MPIDDQRSNDQQSIPDTPDANTSTRKVRQATVTASQAMGRAAVSAGQRVTAATGKATDRAVGTVTQRENWASVELYLAQVVEVLAAHEAEILALRQQVDQLTARLNDVR